MSESTADKGTTAMGITKLTSITTISIMLFGAGCSFIARGEDQYREDTRALLQTKNEEIRACYDSVLATDPNAQGRVVVNFTVEKKTGQITEVTPVTGDTSAPEPLTNCVVTAIDGLRLTPEDRRDGDATFTWEFNNPAAGQV